MAGPKCSSLLVCDQGVGSSALPCLRFVVTKMEMTVSFVAGLEIK